MLVLRRNNRALAKSSGGGRAAMTPQARTDWERIKARYESGEDVPDVARRMAEEVLGVPFVRVGRAQRPDFADRAAADDSFDGGMVVL